METDVKDINSFALPSDPHLQALFAAMCERIQALESEVHAMRAELDEYRELNELERALDRKRLSKIEAPGMRPAQDSQGEVLRALLVVNGGKMLQSEAIKTMRISKSRMSELLSYLKNEVGSKPFHKDRRQNIIFIK